MESKGVKLYRGNLRPHYFWACPLKTDLCSTLMLLLKGQRLVQPAAFEPHIAEDSYEHGLTQNCKVT